MSVNNPNHQFQVLERRKAVSARYLRGESQHAIARPILGEKKLPQSTEEEFDAYIWDESNNRKKGEEPVKENDHGMDALRYMVAHLEMPTFDAPPRPERPREHLTVWHDGFHERQRNEVRERWMFGMR